MWKMMKRLVYMRIGQKLTRTATRRFGFGTTAVVMAIIGAMRMMRKNSSATRRNSWAS